MFTVICDKFIEVTEIEENVKLNAFASCSKMNIAIS